MSVTRTMRLEVIKTYEFTVTADSEAEARERCELVADRRIRKNRPKVEGEIPMKELKEKWSWRIVEKG
jgi:hypothetical protein